MSCQSIFHDDVEPSYQVINTFAKEVKITDNLRLVGFGGGTYKGLSYNLTFLSSNMPNLDEARALFYNISIRFLNLLNSDDNLRSMAEDNLFTIENITLRIMFSDSPGHISYVSNRSVSDRNPLQLVDFYTFKNNEERLSDDYEEAYEQVKSIVESQGLNYYPTGSQQPCFEN